MWRKNDKKQLAICSATQMPRVICRTQELCVQKHPETSSTTGTGAAHCEKLEQFQWIVPYP